MRSSAAPYFAPTPRAVSAPSPLISDARSALRCGYVATRPEKNSCLPRTIFVEIRAIVRIRVKALRCGRASHEKGLEMNNSPSPRQATKLSPFQIPPAAPDPLRALKRLRDLVGIVNVASHVAGQSTGDLGTDVWLYLSLLIWLLE